MMTAIMTVARRFTTAVMRHCLLLYSIFMIHSVNLFIEIYTDDDDCDVVLYFISAEFKTLFQRIG